jgi:hypothetical protein
MSHNAAPLVGGLRVIPLGATMVQIAPENAGRCFLSMLADADVLFTTTSPTGATMPLAAGVAFEPAIPFGDAIYARAASGTANLTLGEA